jgi:hypothetical protein
MDQVCRKQSLIEDIRPNIQKTQWQLFEEPLLLERMLSKQTSI